MGQVVYVACETYQDYDEGSTGILGVFTSQELAQATLDRVEAQCKAAYENPDISTWGKFSCFAYSIDEFILDKPER